jgi:hypothetical protein
MKKYFPVGEQETALQFLSVVRVCSRKNKLSLHKKFVSEKELMYHWMNVGGGEK